MKYANKYDVEYLLLKSDVSNYRISKETGISEATLNKYKRGDSSLENMTFGNAVKLQGYYDKLKKDDGLMKTTTREENFGRALAVLESVGKRRFEKNKPSISALYKSELGIKPMSSFTNAHKDIMQYADHFDAVDIELLDIMDDYVSAISIDEFNDEPLGGKYLLHFSKESVSLRKYEEEN